MASGASNEFRSTFTGVAADVVIGKVPFKAKMIRFWTLAGVWGIKIVDEEGMDGDAYVSNSGVDAGVTIAADGTITIANGADVNSAGDPVYYECSE